MAKLPSTDGWAKKHQLFIKWKYAEAKVCPASFLTCPSHIKVKGFETWMVKSVIVIVCLYSFGLFLL